MNKLDRLNRENELPKLIYISGGGHSGTTILDLIISSSPEVFTIGEGKHFDDRILGKNSTNPCSCGKSYSECDYWKEIKEKESTKINFEGSLEIKHIFNNFLNIIFFKIKFFQLKKNIAVNYWLSNCFEVAKKLKPDMLYILDSSKDPFHLNSISSKIDYDIFIIHIIRDCRGYAYSYNNPQRRAEGLDIKTYARSLLEWIIVNLLTIKVINNFELPFIRLSYEEFCTNPQIIRKKINSSLGINIPKDFISAINKDTHHNIEGNNLRFKKVETIKKDEKWKKNLPYIAKLAIGFFSIPIYKFLLRKPAELIKNENGSSKS
jgi:hypothetical protein